MKSSFGLEFFEIALEILLPRKNPLDGAMMKAFPSKIPKKMNEISEMIVKVRGQVCVELNKKSCKLSYLWAFKWSFPLGDIQHNRDFRKSTASQNALVTSKPCV